MKPNARIKLELAILAIVILGTLIHYAVPAYISGSKSTVAFPYVRNGEDYQIAAHYNATSFIRKQWGKEEVLVFRCIVISPNAPGVYLSGRGTGYDHENKVFLWTSQPAYISDSDNQSLNADHTPISLEFHLRRKLVKLVNTGEELLFISNEIYYVDLNKNLEPVEFGILRSAKDLQDKHHELYSFVNSRIENPFEP